MEKLTFKHGPMGSRKTAELLISAYNYEEHGNLILVTKPAKDTKGGHKVVSRVGIEREVDFLATPEMDIEAEVVRRNTEVVRDQNMPINALLVDEAQFLKPRQVDQLFRLAVVHYIPVFAYGLRTDFRTRTFPGSRRLMEVAHEQQEFTTTCAAGNCRHNAMFNARKVNGEYVTEGDQVAIDGKDEITYSALCGKDYIKLVGPLPETDEEFIDDAAA